VRWSHVHGFSSRRCELYTRGFLAVIARRLTDCCAFQCVLKCSKFAFFINKYCVQYVVSMYSMHYEVVQPQVEVCKRKLRFISTIFCSVRLNFIPATTGYVWAFSAELHQSKTGTNFRLIFSYPIPVQFF